MIKNELQKEIQKDLLEALPRVFGRKAVTNLLPGIINARTLANLDWSGDGPPLFKIGRTVCYRREPFVNWLLSRM